MRKGKVQVLLVTTLRTKRWVVPKGWPINGKTPGEAAATEAFEEGGVEGRVQETCIGIFTYLKELPDDDLPCAVAVFPLKVTAERKDWPERRLRQRRWLRPKKAAQLVSEPELSRLLLDFDPERLPG